jgi:WD40 repeat protein/DNA-binding SARP family transcriptional activator
MLQIRLLGRFDVYLDEKQIIISSRVGQSLFAYLALQAGTPHRREKLAGIFWPKSSDESARKNLRQELWRIRKALPGQSLSAGHAYLLSDEYTITFNPEADYWLDVAILENSNLDPQALAASLSLYQGELLPGFYDDWVVFERDRIQTVFESRMERLVETLAEAESWKAVQEHCERWLALGSSPEPAYRALMISHHMRGNAAQLRSSYRRCIDDLRDRFGVEPSGETHALYNRLLKGARAQLDPLVIEDLRASSPLPKTKFTGREVPIPGESPFKGLQYFEEADSDLFFGRELLIAKLLRRLRDSQFLSVIIGASGSGKSSLVRAGLIPALRKRDMLVDGTRPPEDRTNWQIYIITPTARPLEALATELSRDLEIGTTERLTADLAQEPHSLAQFFARIRIDARKRVVLVVDQFEELFTLCRDEFEREAFVDNLLDLVAAGRDNITLIIALRADFYPHLAQYPELREAVVQQQEYIGPMTVEELRRAIEEPARRGHWEFEPGLVDLILRDVGGEPGALPLLSHALLETWKRRAGRTLTLRGYADAGGVRGAIAHTAESVYQHLTSQERTIARNIFLRLTELGEGTEDTRRRASFEELVSSTENIDEVRRILNMLANERLITLSEDTVEVAHEALIREWPALREWLNQDRAGLQLHRHLTEAAHDWEILGGDPGALYRGTRLAQATEWAALHSQALNAGERAFLDASIKQEQREQREREEQRQRELQAAQKLAEAERARAEAQAHYAEQAKLSLRRAEAQRLALESNRLLLSGGSPEQIALLSLRSMKTHYTLEGDAALAAAARLNYPVKLFTHTPAVWAVAFSPDAKYALTGSGDETARLWDVDSGQELHRFTGHTAMIASVTFSPDGKHIVTASADKSAILWNATTGEEIRRFVGHTLAMLGVTYSPDGKSIFTSAWDYTVRQWDVETGQEMRILRNGSYESASICISRDGKYLLTSGSTTLLWDLETGQTLHEFVTERNFTQATAFSADGNFALTGGTDNIGYLWDIKTGNQIHKFIGHTNILRSVKFSPDGRCVLTASGDHTIRIWDIETGQELRRFPCSADVSGAEISPDGTLVLAGSGDGRARIWRLDASSALPIFRHGTSVSAVAFSPDGKLIVTGGAGGTARIWDAVTGQILHDLTVHTDSINYGVVFSPDGKYIVTASWDYTVRLWNAQTGDEVRQFSGHTAAVNSVEFSSDGKYIVTAGLDIVRLWNASTGQEIRQFGESPAVCQRASFSPDGKFILTAASGFDDGKARLWEVATGKLIREYQSSMDGMSSVTFSPDGKYMLTAGVGKIVDLWEVQTGKQLHQLVGHTNEIYTAAFSPDGKLIATASMDNTARLWDAQTGQELRRLIGHTAGLENVVFSPDGKYILTASDDGTAMLWDVDYHTTMDYLCSKMLRDFTVDERLQFGISDQDPTCPAK